MTDNPYVDERLRNAWTLGERAGLAGLDLGACPYEQEGAERHAWYGGHAAAARSPGEPEPEPEAQLWATFSKSEPDDPVPAGAGRTSLDVEGWPCEVRVASHDSEYAHARLEALGAVGELQHGGASLRRWFFREVRVGPVMLYQPGAVELAPDVTAALDRALAELRARLADDVPGGVGSP